MPAPRMVTFHYVLRDKLDRILDTSAGGEPIVYLEGAGQIVEGLEEQLQKLPSGAKCRLLVPAAKGYGLRDEAQVQRVPRSVLPVEGALAVGDQFQAGEDRFAPIVRVAKVEGEHVWLDANHPLAGVDLIFDVEIVSVRDATREEISRAGAPGRDGQAAF